MRSVFEFSEPMITHYFSYNSLDGAIVWIGTKEDHDRFTPSNVEMLYVGPNGVKRYLSIVETLESMIVEPAIWSNEAVAIPLFVSGKRKLLFVSLEGNDIEVIDKDEILNETYKFICDRDIHIYEHKGKGNFDLIGNKSNYEVFNLFDTHNISELYEYYHAAKEAVENQNCTVIRLYSDPSRAYVYVISQENDRKGGRDLNMLLSIYQVSEKKIIGKVKLSTKAFFSKGIVGVNIVR